MGFIHCPSFVELGNKMAHQFLLSTRELHASTMKCFGSKSLLLNRCKPLQ